MTKSTSQKCSRPTISSEPINTTYANCNDIAKSIASSSYHIRQTDLEGLVNVEKSINKVNLPRKTRRGRKWSRSFPDEGSRDGITRKSK
ncbi:Hypothetical protein NTJ_05748 [Nesidiocoris tenuis]|uniref:Uncharacterized protein n=1 Tax=Nesidiocoris tenuis TaxID=355587 RepID=A0ABN7ANW4_9HEMI|nr:Hypothetical protein NTJ_05748 [Nesidiocoris tenuis]